MNAHQAPGRGPDSRSRVVRLGALCGRSPLAPYQEAGANFCVSEFVDLEDGQRIILHKDRGFSISPWISVGEPIASELSSRDSLEALARDVLNVVLPDDDECEEDHPWSWLAELAQAHGLMVTADDLCGLPYEVIFTDEVRQWVNGPPEG